MTVEQLRAELAAAIKQGYYDAVALGSFDERGFWQSLDGPETAADRVVESEPIRALPALLDLYREAQRNVAGCRYCQGQGVVLAKVMDTAPCPSCRGLRAAVVVVDGYLTPETEGT